jgi:hypothetical protein
MFGKIIYSYISVGTAYVNLPDYESYVLTEVPKGRNPEDGRSIFL